MAQPKPPIAYLVDLFSDEFGELSNQIVIEIKNNIAVGMEPTTAVNMALSKLGVGQKITDSILTKLVTAAAIGFGVEPKLIVDPMGIRTTFLNNHWAGDKLTLSRRIARADYKQIIVDTVSSEMRRASSWTKTAQALTDKGLLIGALPAHIDRLETAARKAFVDQPELKSEFISTLKQVEKRVQRMSLNGSPNQTVKAAYNEIITAATNLNQRAMDKAITQAVKDKARYNAERIARTEMARAYGAAFDLKVMNDTDVVAVRIMLSSRHPHGDICDFHTHANLYGMGPGVFPKGKQPRYPFHPHCLCIKVEVFEGEVEFNDQMSMAAGAAYIEKQPADVQRTLLGIDGQKAFAKNPGTWQKHLVGWEGHQEVKLVHGLKPEMFVRPDETLAVSPLTAQTLEQKVAAMESRIRPQVFESAAAFDINGNQLFFKNGAATSVTFTSEEVSMMYGGVVTHNHPRGWGYPESDLRRGGNSFSLDDVALAAKAKAKEMRAASPWYNHSIKPGPDGWSIEMYKEKIVPAYEKHKRSLYSEQIRDLQAGKLNLNKAEADFIHDIWTRVAKEIGLIYSRERIP